MAELKNLMIHCLDTPSGKNFTSGDIGQWHLGPKDLPNGEIKYKGKVYPSREELPKEYINGFLVRKLYGRGWSKVGYSDLIHLDGTLENLISYNEDNWVDSNEISNGASGFNANTRHIGIVGGKGFKMADFAEVLTPDQFITLQTYIKEFLGKHPNCKVVGHYQVNPHKACPGFNVPAFLRFLPIPEKNIFV
jgi:hypothetical protein